MKLRLTSDLEMYAHTRGRELPGNYNHVLLTELFHFQSKRWGQIAFDHVELVHKALKSFVTALSEHITDEERIALEITRQVNERLTTHMNQAESELQSLVDDENQQPITYNHYYTDNVQKARQKASRDLIDNIVKDTAKGDTAEDDFYGSMHSKKKGVDIERLVNALQKHVVVDMDEQACTEVRAGFDAYYKVSNERQGLSRGKLTRCRLRARRSSTMCANKSLNDTFFVHFQRSSHLKQ